MLHKQSFAVSAGLIGLLVVAISGIFPWSRLNCWEVEVDINSGDRRDTRYLLFVPYYVDVQPTWLSQHRKEPRERLEPSWQKVTTLSPGTHHSPHYRYHSAAVQLATLQTIEEVGGFATEDRSEVASHILKLWQDGKCRTARHYIDGIFLTALQRLEQSR